MGNNVEAVFNKLTFISLSDFERGRDVLLSLLREVLKNYFFYSGFQNNGS